MPELPEVETVRNQLARKVVGKTISGVEVFHAKSVAFDGTIEDTLLGKTIATIDRIGKLLIVSFKMQENLFLLAHLKMTGQFFYVDSNQEIAGGGHSMTKRDITDLPNKHTRVAFYFDDSSVLYFNDMRLFGYTKLASKAEVAVARGKFGPEPIDPDFDCTTFSAGLKKRSALIKAVLLNQSFVAGLGNIYVDEALYRAHVKPTRRANTLTKGEAGALCVATSDVLKESIKVGGTTFQHFVDTDGENGNFSDYLQVFGKQGQVCGRCGTVIKKTKVAGRGTHFCPGCQK